MPVSLRQGQMTTDDDIQALNHRCLAERLYQSDIQCRFRKHNQRTQNREKCRRDMAPVMQKDHNLLRAVATRK